MPSARFLRFCAVGASSFAGSLALFAALMYIAGIPYLPAFAITFCVMNAAAYLASRRFVFRTTTVERGEGLVRYFCVAAFTLMINAAAMKGLVDGLGVLPLVASVVMAGANMPVTYLMHRHITFKAAPPGEHR